MVTKKTNMVVLVVLLATLPMYVVAGCKKKVQIVDVKSTDLFEEELPIKIETFGSEQPRQSDQLYGNNLLSDDEEYTEEPDEDEEFDDEEEQEEDYNDEEQPDDEEEEYYEEDPNDYYEDNQDDYSEEEMEDNY